MKAFFSEVLIAIKEGFGLYFAPIKATIKAAKKMLRTGRRDYQ